MLNVLIGVGAVLFLLVGAIWFCPDKLWAKISDKLWPPEKYGRRKPVSRDYIGPALPRVLVTGEVTGHNKLGNDLVLTLTFPDQARTDLEVRVSKETAALLPVGCKLRFVLDKVEV